MDSGSHEHELIHLYHVSKTLLTTIEVEKDPGSSIHVQYQALDRECDLYQKIYGIFLKYASSSDYIELFLKR